MGENKGLDGGKIAPASFSHLMFAAEVDGGVSGFNCLPSCFPADRSPQMLCFGGYGNEPDLPFAETAVQKSGLTCSDSSSASSASTTLFKSSRKRSESGEGTFLGSIAGADGAPVGGMGRFKKTKTGGSMSGGGHTPLGERVTALQQLVSPYGKSDTASVLHEAMGYIRFLHDQVHALCSPFLQTMPSCSSSYSVGDAKDLRSRGLCLVPVACTAQVPGSNGADFWSSARGNV